LLHQRNPTDANLIRKFSFTRYQHLNQAEDEIRLMGLCKLIFGIACAADFDGLFK